MSTAETEQGELISKMMDSFHPFSPSSLLVEIPSSLPGIVDIHVYLWLDADPDYQTDINTGFIPETDKLPLGRSIIALCRLQAQSFCFIA